MIAAFIIIGAIGFWLRGAELFSRITGRGATTARIVAWALPMGGLSATLTDWQNAAAIAVALYAGALLGWWQSLDLGRREGSWARDFALHTARGVLWTLPAALVCGGSTVAVAMSPSPMIAATISADPWLLAAGLLCAPLYEIGWRAYPARATEIGEALFGAVIGAALFMALQPIG